ncbi:MAG: hypothetical protein J6V48_09855 [Clostridia bacterium]|nr:hypothetical protein [Clostridia bacterium]
MRPEDFLNAMASVDERFTEESGAVRAGEEVSAAAAASREAAEEEISEKVPAGKAPGPAGAKPARLRYIVAAAVTLLLLVAAGFSVFIVNSVIRRRSGEQHSDRWQIRLNEVRLGDQKCIGSYLGDITKEDSDKLLEIWNRYRHEEGCFDNMPDVRFSAIPDEPDGSGEFFEYDSSDGLMQYSRWTGGKKNGTGGTYAYFSETDQAEILEIIERYKKDLVRWTLRADGTEYPFPDEEISLFSDFWFRETGSGKESYTLLRDWGEEEKRKIIEERGEIKGEKLIREIEARQEKALEIAGTVENVRETFTLTLHNTAFYDRSVFIYYADARVLEFLTEESGSGVTDRRFLCLGEESAAAIEEIVSGYLVSEYLTYKVTMMNETIRIGDFISKPTNILYTMCSEKTGWLQSESGVSVGTAGDVIRSFGNICRIYMGGIRYSGSSVGATVFFLQYAKSAVPFREIDAYCESSVAVVYNGGNNTVLVQDFVNPFAVEIPDKYYIYHSEWITRGENIFLLQTVTYQEPVLNPPVEYDSQGEPIYASVVKLIKHYYVFLVTCRYADGVPDNSCHPEFPGSLEFILVEDGEGYTPSFSFSLPD